MAPVALDPNLSYIPLALAASHVSAVVFLTSIIGLGLYRSYTGLGPAQETRQRVLQRRKLTTMFAGLAALSFVTAVTSGISYLTLSYKVWASERGIEVPDSIFGNSTAQSVNGTGIYITRWLSETPVYTDALEILNEKARRLWWGQQLDLAAVSWTMLLSIEGRRRQVAFLWAYSLLARLVSLSFAQNLFYVALLLTPSPIPIQDSGVARLINRVFPPKPANWVLKPSLYFTSLILNYAATVGASLTPGTDWFPTVVGLARALAFAPLILPTIVPQSWGTAGLGPHDAYGGISKLYRFMSAASVILHAKTSVFSLFYNLPDAYVHRHSLKIPFDTVRRSAWERSATSVEKILGALSDHPVVAAAGRDVLLSALSLGLWAAVRAMDAKDILKSTIPGYEGTEKVSGDETLVIPTTEESPFKEESPIPASEYAMALRRSGRSHKPRFPSLGSSNGFSDEGTPTPAPRRRPGRPKKVKSEPEPDPEEVPGDTTYQPTPAVRASVVGDAVSDSDFDWESTALTWGLSALGGLGVGSSGVFGAECISR